MCIRDRALIPHMNRAQGVPQHVPEQIPANTTLAFVHTKPGGDREFSFYRKPGADMLLSEADLDQALVTDGTIFHFGTVSCTHEGVRNATFAAARMAKAAGRLVSFDPNLRPPLWDDLEEARASMDQGCRLRCV